MRWPLPRLRMRAGGRDGHAPPARKIPIAGRIRKGFSIEQKGGSSQPPFRSTAQAARRSKRDTARARPRLRRDLSGLLRRRLSRRHPLGGPLLGRLLGLVRGCLLDFERELLHVGFHGPHGERQGFYELSHLVRRRRPRSRTRPLLDRKLPHVRFPAPRRLRTSGCSAGGRLLDRRRFPSCGRFA